MHFNQLIICCCFYRLFVRIFLPMIWSDMVWNLSCICCSRVWTCETNGTNTVSATIKPQINKEGCFTEDGSHTLNLLLSWFLYFLWAASINKYHRNQTLMHKRKWLFRFNVLIAPRFNTTMKYSLILPALIFTSLCSYWRFLIGYEPVTYAVSLLHTWWRHYTRKLSDWCDLKRPKNMRHYNC